MRTPVFVGLIELDPQPWVDIGALILAQQLALPGHRVVVIDADPRSARLSAGVQALHLHLRASPHFSQRRQARVFLSS